MTSPDFTDRTYTAEVIKCGSHEEDTFKAILRLTRSPELEIHADEVSGISVKVCHAYLPSQREYHRLERTVTLADGTEVRIPRRVSIRGREFNLYDVFVAHAGKHIIISVPFHELAEEFFLRVDRTLGGRGISYEKLDITAMVMKLGAAGRNVTTRPPEGETSLSVTRCHLAYLDQQARTSNLQQIRITGADLGLTKEYKSLVAPVLDPRSSELTVTPVVLGFALSNNGVRKSSATTDRHGNFKLWIAPGLRRLIRLFDLLRVLETMKGITLTTANVPILQSRSIREAED